MNARRHLSWVLRLTVSAVLIGLLVSRLDVGHMGRYLLDADLFLVAITLVTVLMDRCLMAGRWIVLLEGLGIRAPRRKVVKIFFLSTFFGSFLPTGIGGEAVRAVSLSRLTSRGVEAVTSVAMDRVLGMFSMLLTGLAAFIISYRVYSHPALLSIVLVLSVTTAVGLVVGLSRSMHRRIQSRIDPAQEGQRWRGRILQAVEALGRYRSRVGLLAFVLVMSIGVQILRVLQAFLLSEAMSLETPMVYFFCFVPLILIITMLPISVSGLGTTNLAYVALFGRVGMDPNGAFVLSILILALGVVGNLPGGVIYALEGFSSARSVTADPDADCEILEPTDLLESER